MKKKAAILEQIVEGTSAIAGRNTSKRRGYKQRQGEEILDEEGKEFKDY